MTSGEQSDYLFHPAMSVCAFEVCELVAMKVLLRDPKLDVLGQH